MAETADESQLLEEINRLEKVKRAKERYLSLLVRGEGDKAASEPLCSNCEQPIYPHEKSCKLGGFVYHVAHFVCFHCKKELGGSFWGHEGLPYCKEHYEELCAERCGGCKKILGNDEFLEVAGQKLHPQCFACHECQKPIEGKFSNKENVFRCLDCVLPKCAACQKPIAGEYLEVGEKTFHKECHQK